MKKSAQAKTLNFFKDFKVAKYETGDFLIKPDNPPKGVSFLKEGLVRMFSISQRGGEITLNVFKPGSFFPLGWALNDKDNIYYYSALSPVTVFTAPKDKVVSFLKQEPDVIYDLLSRIYKGLDGFFLMMETLLGSEANRKVATQIVIQTKRFGKIQKDGTHLVSITHAELASLSGVARETATRQINKLQSMGLVSYKNKGLLEVNLEKLEQNLL